MATKTCFTTFILCKNWYVMSSVIIIDVIFIFMKRKTQEIIQYKMQKSRSELVSNLGKLKLS